MILSINSNNFNNFHSSSIKTETYPSINKIISGTRKNISNEHKRVFNKKFYKSQLIEYRLKNIYIDAFQQILSERASEPIRDTTLSSILLLEIEKTTTVSIEVKNYLMNDFKLLSTISKIANIISSSDHKFFNINMIDIGNDPEEPDWKPILIKLNIKLDKIEDRLRLKHVIIKKIFKEIGLQDRKKIRFVGAI